jgi:hypothetical protein
MIEARKNQTFIIRMYNRSLLRVNRSILLNEPIRKMGVKPFQILAFHPHTWLLIQPYGRLLDK